MSGRARLFDRVLAPVGRRATMIEMLVFSFEEREVRTENDVVTIGSDHDRDVVIAAAHGLHATIFRNEHGDILLLPEQGDVVHGRKRYRNGNPLRLAEQDRVTIANVQIEIRRQLPEHYVAVDARERELLAAVTAGDDGARLVYADWCEQRGDATRAEFLRVQHAVMRADDMRPEIQRAMARLRELARSLDVAWRRAVARQFVEGCAALEAPCPMDWAKMAPTERADVRRCDGCHKDVYYVTTIAQAQRHAMRGHCVAVDSALVRTPNDLRPRPIMPGAPPPPPRR